MPRSDSQSSGEDVSGCSSDERPEKVYVPHSKREEWRDVVPLPQDDDKTVASIKYSDQYAETFDYFRAILHLNEKSPRAFDLTTECIELNASNYTVWYFRRVLLKELKKDFHDELKFLNDIISACPKNYQVWHHRQWLIESINSVKGEKEFIGEILEADSKNYHCWQHRQWLVKHFAAWDDELQFTEKLLSQDIRNNAAWHHRYFVIQSTEGFTDDVINREACFTLDKINLASNNESSWNYLRGILSRVGLSSLPSVVQCVRTFIDNLDSKTTPYAIAFEVDILTEKIEKEVDAQARSQLIEQAVKLCDQLAQVNDTVRCTYWQYIGESLRSKS